ncbi:MAG TPA: AbrB/MazE/SpoVT family DNA-binding domain-containing protein [Candidatus Angelobacter sp.]|jgi:antitoxin MazE|nr:AbrB/MazE/SpoVT family DNA-binding domain-containing protein [Candidatus Angelobacter sp.]
MKAQIVKWGNSLAVRIPKLVVQEARMKEGDSLEIQATQDCIELRRITQAPSLSRLIAQITPENRYGEVSTRVEVGRETTEW